MPWPAARSGDADRGRPFRILAVSDERDDALVLEVNREAIGTITMDQLMVDCGDDFVAPGDEAVLIGVQGGHEITATEWAERGGTIAYEVVTGLSPRLPRRYEGEEPEPA